jgi:hypothetical protein
MSNLEGRIELSPVGDSGLLEDSFGCVVVLVQGFGFSAESQIRHNHITACFEEAEGKCERDTAAAASDKGSLAAEIIEGHVEICRRFIWGASRPLGSARGARCSYMWNSLRMDEGMGLFLADA